MSNLQHTRPPAERAPGELPSPPEQGGQPERLHQRDAR
jgi:hypothetical protein